jgi:hypothetical protein
MNMKTRLISKLISLALVFGAATAFGQRAVMVNSNNGTVVYPTNLWTINASSARSGLSLAAHATNPIVPVTSGGSGSTNAAGARTNLGLAWSGLTNTNVTNFRSAIGLGATNDVAFNNFAANTININNLSFASGILQWDGDDVVEFFTNKIVLFKPIEFNNTNIAPSTRTNLGLGWSALTNSNAATSLLGVATNGNVVYSGTNQLTFSNAVSLYTGNYSNSATGTTVDLALALWDIANDDWSLRGNDSEFQFNGDTRRDNFRIALGLGWSALTNSNAGTGLVSVNTNGVVVSPTNFWQVAPITTTFIDSQPTTNQTTNIAAGRNLHIHSIAPSTAGITNTIALPTTGSFNGDIALVVHQGPTSSVTAVRTAGAGTNLITLNQFEEAVEFVYYNSVWQFNHNLSYIEPISTNGNVVYTGTNNLNFTNYVYFDSATSIGGSAGEFRYDGVVAFELETMMFERPLSFNGTAGGETRTNLGLGATWLTNTDVTNFRSAIGLGATNDALFANISATNGANISGQALFYDVILLAEQATIDFGDAVDTTRTNLSLGATWLTNTNNASFQGAIFSATNAAPTNTTNVNAWVDIQVGTNSFKMPLYK